MESLQKPVLKNNFFSALNFLTMARSESLQPTEIIPFPASVSRFQHRDIAPLGPTSINGEKREYTALMDLVKHYDQDSARLAERHAVLVRKGALLNDHYLTEGNKIEILKIASCYFMEENVHFDTDGNMRITSRLGTLVFNAYDAAHDH